MEFWSEFCQNIGFRSDLHSQNRFLYDSDRNLSGFRNRMWETVKYCFRRSFYTRWQCILTTRGCTKSYVWMYIHIVSTMVMVEYLNIHFTDWINKHRPAIVVISVPNIYRCSDFFFLVWFISEGFSPTTPSKTHHSSSTHATHQVPMKCHLCMCSTLLAPCKSQRTPLNGIKMLWVKGHCPPLASPSSIFSLLWDGSTLWFHLILSVALFLSLSLIFGLIGSDLIWRLYSILEGHFPSYRYLVLWTLL